MTFGGLFSEVEIETLVKTRSKDAWLTLIDGADVSKLEKRPHVERQAAYLNTLHARVVKEQRELLGFPKVKCPPRRST